MRMNDALAALAAVAVAAAEVSAAAVPLDPAPIVSVGLYKNGMAVVTRRITPGEDGVSFVDANARPAYGSFWLVSGGGVSVSSTKADVLRENVDAGFAEGWTGAYDGRKIEVAFRCGVGMDQILDAAAKTGSMKVLAGTAGESSRICTVRGTAVKDESERAAEPIGRRNMYYGYASYYYEPPKPKPAKSLNVRLESGSIVSVPESAVVSVRSDDGDSRGIARAMSVWRFDGAKAPFDVQYIATGACWTPSYRVDLADGKGASTIANELNAEGILTRRGKYWSYTRIRDIVANPIYIGDALYQKTYMDEHFRQRRNDGELDMFYHEGHHEPIIDRETFDAANASFSTVALPAPAENPFTGKLYCAKCGCTMYHHASKGRGRFICTAKRKHKEPCGNTPAREDDIKAAFVTLLNKLAFSQSQAQPSCRILDEYAKRKGEQDNAADRLREIDAELSENRDEQTLLAALALAGRLTVEHRHRKQELLSRERKLLDEQQILQNRTGQADELREFVNHWQITDSVESFPAEAFQTLVERVDVQSGISAAFRFACGLTLTESLRAWR